MAEAGSKRGTVAAMAVDHFLEALEPLGEQSGRGMFGGYGVFSADGMFGLVDSSGHWCLKADPELAGELEAVGSARHGRMPYWSVPAEVVADAETFLDWGRRARALAGKKR